MNRPQRRKNYFIKKKFQASFFVKFVSLLLLEAILIAALFMLVSRDTLTTAYYGTEIKLQRTGAFFFMSFLLITLLVGIAIGITGMLVFMFFSHRIAGPLHRFEKTVEEAQGGDFAQRINLRKTDQLHELRERTNDFLKEIDSRISSVKNDVQEGLEVIRRDREKGNIDKVAKILEKIQSSLKYFKTSK